MVDATLMQEVKTSYVHVGRPIPSNLRDLTDEEKERYTSEGYVKFEEYGPEKFPWKGNYWTQKQLDRVFTGCGGETIVSSIAAVAYTRSPRAYGTTFCSHCRNHFPIGITGAFVWTGTDERVGA